MGKVGLAVIAAVAALALAGCGAAQGGAGSPGSAASSGGAVSVSGSVPSGGERGVVLSGVGEGWLDGDRLEGLEAALSGYFGDGARLRVAGGPDDDGSDAVLYVEDLSSGGFYEARLRPGGRWSVGPLRRLVEGVNAQGAETPDEGLDATGPLTSRAASFDAGACVAASDAAALSGVVGGRCAEAFPGALSAYLAGRGVLGVSARDVMVERAVERDGGVVSFEALAVSGNERIVVSCRWSEADGSFSFEVFG